LHADNAAGQVAPKPEWNLPSTWRNRASPWWASAVWATAAPSLFVQQAARAGLIGLSVCQSDPMVVPFGGAEIYYGTNPLAFAAPARRRYRYL
jgi:ureidoglycolate dehydrogenase (NAD+)